MESPNKAEGKTERAARPDREAQNDSDEELTPPSPIDIASVPALASEFGAVEPAEGKRMALENQNRLKTILEVAGVTGLTEIDARTFQDPEILRKLTNSVSCALDEAASALTRMKSEKHTYESFLRGASQAPSPLSIPAIMAQQLKQQQQQLPSPPTSSIAMPTNMPTNSSVSGSKVSGGVAAVMTQPKGGQPQAQQNSQQQQQQPTPSDSMQTVQRLLTQGHTIQEATEDGESLLSLACSAGYYELAEVLLRMRASVEDRGVKGDSTPLMEAASGGYADIVKLLIDHGANVNAKSSVGNTALTYACCGGFEDVVRILLNAGANVEHQNDNGHTPLMEAASCGHVGVAKLLLDYGTDINTHSNEFKESALTLACYKGHLEMVKFLLSAGADQEHKTDEMHTALMEASMDGHVDVARLLLDHGAQVNMPMDSFESPLTLAACGGHFELAALLLSRGADLGEVNDEGYTPLMEGAREGHEDIVRLLVEQGAKVNTQAEETQETALTLASCGGFLDVVKYLVEHDADIKLGASTPLMEAAQEGHVNIIKYLIEKGADVRASTNTGDSALTYACAHGHTVIADILLQFGAELEHESEGGRTPIMKAARAGHLQTVKFLITKGADVNRRTTNNDHTVLSLASAGGHVSVVQYLLGKGAEPSHMLRDNSTMLIEASRGGHTTVANLLLSQPRDSSPIDTPSVSPAGSVRHLVERPNPDPVVSVRSGAVVGKMVRGRGGRDEGDGEGAAEVGGFSGQAELPRTVMRHSGDGCGAAGEEDSSDLGTSKAKRQKVASDSVAVVPTGPHGILYPQFPAPVRSKPKQQQQGPATSPVPSKSPQKVSSLQYATDSVMAMKNVQNWSNMAATSPFTSTHSSPQSLSQQRQQQEQLIASQMAAISNYTHLIPDDIAQDCHPTPEELVARRLYNSPEKMTCPTIEQQQLMLSVQQCENVGSVKSAQSVFSSGNFSSQIPVPNMKCSSHTNSTTTSVCSDSTSISQSTASCDSQVSPSTCMTLPSVGAPVAAGRGQGEGEERCGDAVGVGRGEGVGGERERRMEGEEEGSGGHASQLSCSAATSSERLNSSPLPNLDATKLIPHLEALADLLQNPTSLENQYLVALAARAQLFSSSLSVEGTAGDACATGTSLENVSSSCAQALPSNLETLAAIAAHVSHNSDPSSLPRGFPGAFETLTSLTSQPLTDEKPPSLTGLDVVNLLSSSADLTKLLPTLAALEMQGGMGLEPGDNSGLPVPITDPSIIKKLWDEMLCVKSNPGYMGALVGDVGVPVRGASAGGPGVDGISLPMKYLNERARPPQWGGGRLPKRPYTLVKTPFLLDGNFQLDIPHPDLEDGERNQLPTGGLPSGYIGPLEQESFPTSEEEDEDEEEEEDEDDDDGLGDEADLDGEDSIESCYLAPGLAALPPGSFEPAINIDQQTESNHDTALTLAATGGHDELVELLINHGANIEHRDKKGCTPLILAATGGHAITVAILLDHNADIESQSDRTKDTALSLACSGGKQEVVELLLAKGANFEHRNVSDYTPLSLAASGGYVNIIKLLLKEGADINSRTGSKLGISPLMLAAMNGHTATVKLLLDRGGDISAQIETNRNTALTLACFQGRHEVVLLLVERNANVEHRAKTGLTPLMEAASGGYHEVGKVLIKAGADVNAAPVPSSKDTALTIAADKGHYKFVDLILRNDAHVDVKNKKGNSPLWLAANGGHLDVVRMLKEYKAEMDSHDNRKVSCLMASFRKGHFKVVKYMVDHVNQFPSDAELTRYVQSLTDNEQVKKCQRCMELIIRAKERQAAKAHKNADILLKEIDEEKKHEEDRKAAAARKRAKKKRQKEKKQQAIKAQKDTEITNGVIGGDTPPEDNPCGRDDDTNLDSMDHDLQDDNDNSVETTRKLPTQNLPKIESSKTLKPLNGIDNSRNGATTSQRLEPVGTRANLPLKKSAETHLKHSKSSDRGCGMGVDGIGSPRVSSNSPSVIPVASSSPTVISSSSSHLASNSHTPSPSSLSQRQFSKRPSKERERGESNMPARSRGNRQTFGRVRAQSGGEVHGPSSPGSSDASGSSVIRISSSAGAMGVNTGGTTPTNSPRKGRKEDGWKEVGRRTKKVSVPVTVFNQVMGKTSSSLVSIRQATNTQIDVDKHTKQSSNRVLTVRGSADAIKQAQMLLHSLARDPTQDVHQLICKLAGTPSNSSLSLPTSSSTSSTTNKRQLPCLFDQLSIVPPARGSHAQAANANVSVASVVSTSTTDPAKAPVKKLSGPSSAAHAGGGMVTRRPVSDRTIVGNKTSAQLAGVSGKHHASSIPDLHHVSTSKPGLMSVPGTSGPVPSGSFPSSVPFSSAGSTTSTTSTNTNSAAKPSVVATSASPGAPVIGAVRRLFSQQQSSSVNNLTAAAGGVGGSSLLGPQPSGFLPALIHMPAPSLALHQGTSSKSTTAYSVKSNAQVGTGASGSSKPLRSKHPENQNSPLPVAKDKPLPLSSSLAKPNTTKLHYSNIIGMGVLPPLDTPATPTVGCVVFGDVIEQPLHQIMKTPMLFHESATQLSKPKKKSTYSDAVGKKNDNGGTLAGKVSLLAAHATTTGGPMGSLPPPQQHKLNLAPGTRPAVTMDIGDKPLVMNYVVDNKTIGRSMGVAWNDVSVLPPTIGTVAAGHAGGVCEMSQPPTSSLTSSLESFQKSASYEDEQNDLSPPMIASSTLGPIGPPSRNPRHPQANIPPPLPPMCSNQISMGGKVPSSRPPSGHSFSPSSVHHIHPKTSPPMLSPPLRNEMSPTTKSPLLGTAPPGFLPPDKSLYNSTFRPIQQMGSGGDYPMRGGDSPNHILGSSNSNYPTIVPTPIRGSRPPLLATPPGYYGSPGPSPEKNSPNKSPPHPMLKASGFNPNAPSFVPMALQRNTTLPPTSSILGPPPSKYPPNFPPPQGGVCSILGNAPPLAGGGGGGPPYNAGGPGGSGSGATQQMISPPVFPGQAPPQAPQPTPLQQQPIPSAPHPMNQTTPPCSSSQAHQGMPPPLSANQSSILGQPPTPPLNAHHMYPHPPQPGGPQNFHNVPPRPHGGHGQAPINQPIPLYGHQLEGNHPMPSQAVTGMIQPHGSAQPFGLNMIPFQSPVPMPNANGPQPGLTFARQPMQTIGTTMKDGFTSGLDHGGMAPMATPPPPLPVGQGSGNHSSSQFVAITSDFNKFGFPCHHYADKMPDDIHLGMGAGGGKTMLLPPPHGPNPQNMMGLDAGGSGKDPLLRRSNVNVLGSNPSDNVFGLSVRQLGGLSVSQVEDLGKAGGGRVGSKGASMEKFPPPGVNLEGFPLIPSDNSNNTLATGSGMLSVGTMVTPSTGYIMLATPGVLPTSSENMTRDSSNFVPAVGGGGGVGGMVPIGTERAQKSTGLPAAAFPATEESDWSKLPSQGIDWPLHSGRPPHRQDIAATSSVAGHMTGTEDVVMPQETLESILQKLSLGDHLSLFKKNEIDLNALKLMSETDFAEIGLPLEPCQKLLQAMKASSTQQQHQRLQEISKTSPGNPIAYQPLAYSESSSRSSSRSATRPSSRQQQSD